MAVMLNMIPVDQKQNTTLKNGKSKDGTNNGKTDKGFAETLTSETDKSGMNVDSNPKSDDTMQLMAAMSGLVGQLAVDLKPIDAVIGNTLGTVRKISSISQTQLGNAMPGATQTQLGNAMLGVAQTQLGNAMPGVAQTQIENSLSSAQLPNATSAIIPQTDTVPVPQAELVNTMSKDIESAMLLSQPTAVNTQVENSKLGQFKELQAQVQNKQIQSMSISTENTNIPANNSVLSDITPVLAVSGTINSLNKIDNKQFDGKKIVGNQVNVVATQPVNDGGLLEKVDAQSLLTPQVAVNVIDQLSSKELKNVDINLPNQTVKDPDAFASMLNQQGIRIENQTSVQPKQGSLQQASDPYDITTQIVDHARLVTGAKNSEMIIQLKPEHLGELTFKVSVENGIVSASFHSNNPEVRNIIESSLYQLKQEMSNQGLKIDNVGVYAGLGQFSSNDQQSSAYQQPVIKSHDNKNKEDFGEVFEATDSANRIVGSTGVDYRI